MGKGYVDNLCDKCGISAGMTTLSGSAPMYIETQMAGGLSARLCTHCRNLWHDHVTITKEWRACTLAEAWVKATALVFTGAGDESLEVAATAIYVAREKLEDRKNDLRRVSMEWLAGKETEL